MNLHETLLGPETEDPQQAIERLKALAEEFKDDFPKLLVVIGAYQGPDRLNETLHRIPDGVIPLIEEIAVFGVFSEDCSTESCEDLKKNPAWEKLKYYRIPRPYEYGENLKNGFDYAIAKGFDYVVVLRGDATYDPACLPLLFLSALLTKSPVVIETIAWATPLMFDPKQAAAESDDGPIACSPASRNSSCAWDCGTIIAGTGYCPPRCSNASRTV